MERSSKDVGSRITGRTIREIAGDGCWFGAAQERIETKRDRAMRR